MERLLLSRGSPSKKRIFFIMETNIVQITNVVFMVTTNPVPVYLVEDWNRQVSLFGQGFYYGCIMVGAWGAFMAVRSAMRYRGGGFPKSED